MGRTKAKGLPVAMVFESKDEFFAAFDGAVVELVNEGRSFTNDDIRDRLPTYPPESNWFGAAMNRAITEFSLVEVGYEKSRTKSRNGGRLIRWAVKGGSRERR